MSSVIFKLGGFELRWYSVCILVGVIFAYRIISKEASRFHIKQDFTFNMLFWTLIIGIVGARAYYVIMNWSYYSSNADEILKIWNGGLAIHGGIIAGLITILIYCKKYRVDAKKILDIVVPGLIVAQAIGRWGNFFNAEAYGSIVTEETLQKMLIIPSFVIKNMYINGAYHLPMFYFESIICFLGYIIMCIIRRKPYTKKGQVVGFYLIWYGVFRAIIEIFRTDSLYMFGIKSAYILSGIMIIVGFYLIAVQARKPKLDELYNSFDDEIKF